MSSVPVATTPDLRSTPVVGKWKADLASIRGGSFVDAKGKPRKEVVAHFSQLMFKFSGDGSLIAGATKTSYPLTGLWKMNGDEILIEPKGPSKFMYLPNERRIRVSGTDGGTIDMIPDP